MPPFPNMWRVGLTFDLPFDLLTWISIGIIYSSRTIYLPSLKLLGQSVLELSVALCVGDWHYLWPWPTDLNIHRGHLLIKDYLKLLRQSVPELSVAQGMGNQHDLWPTDLEINRRPSTYSWTIYPSILKLAGQSIIELLVAQGIGDQHYLLPWPLPYWPEYK